MAKFEPGNPDEIEEFEEAYAAHRTTDPDRPLSSDASPILQRIVALLPAAGAVEAGISKGAVYKETSKLTALSRPYVVLGDKVLGAMRIDLDRDFGSVEHLQDELRSISLPCPPHLIVGSIDRNTRALRRPHVIWLLPPNAHVWNDMDDPRCRRGPVGLFHAVHRGITKKLADVGADLGGLSNPLKIKSPFSKRWSTSVSNHHIFPTLSEWTDWIDIEIESGRGGDDLLRSNNIFGSLRQAAWEFISRSYHSCRHPELFGDDRTALATAVLAELENLVGREDLAKPSHFRTARSVATFTAAAFDPSKLRRRGRLRAPLASFAPQDRKSRAARIVSEERRARTLKELSSAALSHDGMPLTKSAFAELSGRSRPTIDAHWAAVELEMHGRQEYLQLEFYPPKPLPNTKDSDRMIEAAGTDFRHLIEDDFISYRRAIFQTRVSAEDLPKDCVSSCADGAQCRLQKIIVERSGFEADELPCDEIKRETLTGNLSFRLRDWVYPA